MAVRGVLQAATLLLASSALQPEQQVQPEPAEQDQGAKDEPVRGGDLNEQQPEASTSGRPWSAPGAAGSPAASVALSMYFNRQALLGPLEQWLSQRSPPLWVAALELGAWNYAATALQVGRRA